MALLERVDHFFFDIVLRTDDHRAERNEMGVGHAAVVHGDAEEARAAESFGFRRQLLQVTAKRLLTFVQAAYDLQSRLHGRGGLLPGTHGDRIQGLDPITSLVGQVKDAPPLQAGEGLHLGHQRRPLRPRELMELGR